MARLDLHLTGVTDDGNLWHTIRFADGTWQSFFGNVKAQESNNPGPLYAVDCAVDGNDLHVVASTNVTLDPINGGELWHTIRFADGTWQSFFGNVKAQESNNPGHFYDDICCAAAFGILHVLGTTTGDGRLWYTNRSSATGLWQPSFEPVDSKVPSVPGAFFGVSCAVVDNGDLHVITITSGGDAWHTVRSATDNWHPFRTVTSGGANDPRPFKSVSCTAAGGDLHFVGVTDDGSLWHSVLLAGGNLWLPFDPVKAHEANDPGPFSDNISCAVADNGDLHIVGTTSDDGNLWHTIRFADGTWQSFFGNVKAQESNNPGSFGPVGIASLVNFVQ